MIGQISRDEVRSAIEDKLCAQFSVTGATATDEQIFQVDSLGESTRVLHTMVRPTDTVLYENDLPDHYQEA